MFQLLSHEQKVVHLVLFFLLFPYSNLVSKLRWENMIAVFSPHVFDAPMYKTHHLQQCVWGRKAPHTHHEGRGGWVCAPRSRCMGQEKIHVPAMREEWGGVCVVAGCLPCIRHPSIFGLFILGKITSYTWKHTVTLVHLVDLGALTWMSQVPILPTNYYTTQAFILNMNVCSE